MMRCRPRGFVKHAHEMKLADRGDLRESVQVQRLGQVLLHVADRPPDGQLNSFDRVGAMRGCGKLVAHRLEKEQPTTTSNNQHPEKRRPALGHWMFDVG